MVALQFLKAAERPPDDNKRMAFRSSAAASVSRISTLFLKWLLYIPTSNLTGTLSESFPLPGVQNVLMVLASQMPIIISGTYYNESHNKPGLTL